MRRIFKNKALQVTLVEPAQDTTTDISESVMTPEAIQTVITNSAIAIGGVTAGVIVVKTACELTLIVARAILK